jgi:hypothetical protein
MGNQHEAVSSTAALEECSIDSIDSPLGDYCVGTARPSSTFVLRTGRRQNLAMARTKQAGRLSL